MNCPNCNRILPDDSIFCQYCGADVTVAASKETETRKFCSACNKFIWGDSVYCPFCGKKLTDMMTCESIPNNSGHFMKAWIRKGKDEPVRKDNTGMVFILVGIVLVTLILLAVAICAVINSPPASRALINL